MWGETSQWPTILSDPALVLVVYIALKIRGYDSNRTELWRILPSSMVCIVWRCCVVLCNPFAMGDYDIFLLLLLFAWTVKTTDNPHVMLCVWPLELGIWTRACGPLSWGYGLTIHAPRCVAP